MTDIVEELGRYERYCPLADKPTFRKAADEIERLRAELDAAKAELEAAVAEEREACAKACEVGRVIAYDSVDTAANCAWEIRARTK
jgi:multidrug resistance efflux pump